MVKIWKAEMTFFANKEMKCSEEPRNISTCFPEELTRCKFTFKYKKSQTFKFQVQHLYNIRLQTIVQSSPGDDRYSLLFLLPPYISFF